MKRILIVIVILYKINLISSVYEESKYDREIRIEDL